MFSLHGTQVVYVENDSVINRYDFLILGVNQKSNVKLKRPSLSAVSGCVLRDNKMSSYKRPF